MFKVIVMSFGIKHGYFEGANVVYDVRGFKNPYYVEHLRNKCGLDDDVYEYVFSDNLAEEFFTPSVKAAELLIERSAELEKDEFILAYACTGGQHRSVAFARRAYEYFLSKGYDVVIYNRDSGVKK